MTDGEIVRLLAESDPIDGDGFCHHCGWPPGDELDRNAVRVEYPIDEGGAFHREDCLWIVARRRGGQS